MAEFKCPNCERLYNALLAHLEDQKRHYLKKITFIYEPFFEQDVAKRLQYYRDKVAEVDATLLRFVDMKKHELEVK